jgi:hypothetical protein
MGAVPAVELLQLPDVEHQLRRARVEQRNSLTVGPRGKQNSVFPSW